jgi:hypothetical protein
MVTCSHCGGEFKNEHGLKIHVARICQRVSSPPHPEVVVEEVAASSIPTKVRFVSPKSPSLRIVVKPRERTQVLNPGTGGVPSVQSYLTPGKVAEFQDGQFSTDDVEIIDYLEETYAKNPSNSMFPIYSQRIMKNLVKE